MTTAHDPERGCMPPQPSLDAAMLDQARSIIKAILIGWDAEEADPAKFQRALKRARRFVGFKLAATCDEHDRPEPCQWCQADADKAKVRHV